jgi:protein-export membrane protein SecD
LSFNKEGADLFEKITTENVDKTIAIYLDGILVSAPRVNQAISGGEAIIEGNFTIEKAKEMVGRLNSGALPIPIHLISTNTIGPTLGHNAVEAGVQAGIWGLIFVALILVLWYRLPGLIAVIALGIYTAIMLWLFKFIPVTLTSAGIAGFIISIGIAVDANILIFERMKEEIADGRSLYDAIDNGFKRAWASIRDANISSIISAIILFWFGTALIKGFALTFGLGILVSMFSAITVTRSIIMSFTDKEKKQPSKVMKFLFQTGLLGLTKKTK